MNQGMAKTRDPMRDVIRKNLRVFREEAKLTAEKVASFTGIPIDSLRRWESGKTTPPVAALSRLAEVYGHDMKDFTLENPPKPNLKARPGIALIELDGVAVDPEQMLRLQRLVEDINQTTRGLKKAGKR